MVNMIVDVKIAAAIVAYNPDEKRFKECLKSVNRQVDHLYIFNNGNDIKPLIPSNATYIYEGKNCGISYALNVISSKAEEDGYNWLLTMDQDSLLPEGMIDDFKNYIADDVGIICPQVIDKRRKYLYVN